MASPTVASVILSKINRIGRPVLNLLFPKEIEAYYLILELVDADFNPLRSFLFPVMPSEISETHTEITTTSNTYRGVHVIKTDTFVPRSIKIMGTFGRRIYLVNTVLGTRSPLNLSLFGGEALDVRIDGSAEFNTKFKTGFGALNVLAHLKELSKGKSIDGRQRYLFLYNPVMGSNYVVEFKTFSRTENVETSNVLYPYSIDLVAVAHVSDIIGKLDKLVISASALLGRIANSALENPGTKAQRFSNTKQLLSTI